MPNKMSKVAVIVTTTLLLAYFVFTSGIVYEAIGSTVTNRMVTPYSLALSGDRTGLVGIFTKDDQKCAEWVTTQSEKDIPVVCDGNIGLLFRGYQFARVQQITTFTGVFSDEPHYIFLSTWNVETGKMVIGATSAGLRDLGEIPDMDMSAYSEAFRSGKAVIYEHM